MYALSAQGAEIAHDFAGLRGAVVEEIYGQGRAYLNQGAPASSA